MSDRFFASPFLDAEQGRVVAFLVAFYARPFAWFCGASCWRGMVVS